MSEPATPLGLVLPLRIERLEEAVKVVDAKVLAGLKSVPVSLAARVAAKPRT